MVRAELTKTFTGRIVTVLHIVPYRSRGPNSLPKPSPRPERGQRLAKEAKT